MKKIVLFLLVIFAINNLKAQQAEAALPTNDEYVKQLGPLEKFNVAIIADTITEKFSDKKEKARAIFYWIANNISWDAKATRQNDNKKIEPEVIVQLRK